MHVYGNDHRGHARTAPSSKQLGDYGEGSFSLFADDMVRLTLIAKEENPEKPFILLGHSIGSFAARQYVLDHSYSIDGLVLSGSSALDGVVRLAKSAPPKENNILKRLVRPGSSTIRLVEPGCRGRRRIHKRLVVFRRTSARV